MLPDLFFRVRETDILVLRVREDPSTHRIDMTPVAVIKEQTGEPVPRGAHVLTPDEISQIASWVNARQKSDASKLDQICDTLNKTTHWVQAEAEDHEILAAQERLLMSIHDLRTTFVRRISQSNGSKN